MSAVGGRVASVKYAGGGSDIKELVGNNPQQKNWRGIIIALLVILIVLALIVVAIIIVSPKDDGKVLGEPFPFEGLFDPKFKPRNFDAKWIGDKDVFVYRSNEGEVMEYNTALNTSTLVMDNTTFRQLNTDTFFVSEDLNYILIAYDIEMTSRHSFRAFYEIVSRHATEAKDKRLPFPNGDPSLRQKKLQYAGWSSKGNGLTFVVDNDLWYQPDPLKTATRVTNTGEGNTVYNGIPDWLYEEEILGTNKAHWFSPEASYLVYMKYDDRDVPKYRFPYYGTGNNIYDSIAELPYPKAGDHAPNINPKVALYIVDITNVGVESHTQISPPEEFKNRDYYVTSVIWRDESSLLITWSNRVQNESLITLCFASGATCFTNLEVKSLTGWVEKKPVIFLDKGSRYLTVLPERDGKHGFWKHIAMVTSNDDAKGIVQFVTQGTWEVTDLVGYNALDQYVYFISTNGDPRDRHLFRVELPSADGPMTTPECLTCDFPKTCQYISASFSSSGQYYILNCQGPGVPSYTLKSTIDDRDIMLEDNAALSSLLKQYAIPGLTFEPQYEEVEIETGERIWVKFMLPPTLNPEHITVYPVLFEVYGGPGSQMVTNKFNLHWGTYLASARNIIYAMVDGRGTTARGDKWLHSVYKKLGSVEVADTLVAAKYARDKFKYVDPGRIGLWGWSYGGFITTHALGNESSLFRCGMAVAPVTDWRYYDTAYTERYLGMISEEANYRGYDNANVSRKAANFKGKEFMIVHGTADANVHFQHTAQFIKALTESDVDYRVHIYADKNHAISGPTTTKHLYRTLDNFMTRSCWGNGLLRQRKGEDIVNIEVEEA